MKKIFYILIPVIVIVLAAADAHYNGWLLNGNSFSSNSFLGTRDTSQLVIKANNTQTAKFTSTNGNNVFTWWQNTVSSNYYNNITLRDYSTFGYSVVCCYLGTPLTQQGANNYFFWGDSSTNYINAAARIRMGSGNKAGLTINTANPELYGSGRLIWLDPINTTTTSLTGNKTHLYIDGCKYGFAGTPTVTPLKISVVGDTYSATSTGTISDPVTLNIAKPVAGASITITNAWGIKNTGLLGNTGSAIFGTISTPSAIVHISGQSTTVPAMYFASGSLLTTTVNGAVEWNSGQLYATNATNRYKVGYCLTASATLNFPSTTATTVSDLTVTVTGAALNDPVDVGAPNGSMTATASYFGWVSAADVVTIRFSPKATEDPASGTFKISVDKN